MRRILVAFVLGMGSAQAQDVPEPCVEAMKAGLAGQYETMRGGENFSSGALTVGTRLLTITRDGDSFTYVNAQTGVPYQRETIAKVENGYQIRFQALRKDGTPDPDQAPGINRIIGCSGPDTSGTVRFVETSTGHGPDAEGRPFEMRWHIAMGPAGFLILGEGRREGTKDRYRPMRATLMKRLQGN